MLKLINENSKTTFKGGESMKKRTTLALFAMMLAFVLSGGVMASADTGWTDRVAGSDRIDTAVEISKTMYPDGSPIGPRYVILARSDQYADALAGAGLVMDYVANATICVDTSPASGDFPVTPGPCADDTTVTGALAISNPILLTGSSGLDDNVKDEIERLLDLGVGPFGGLNGSLTTEETGTQVYVLGGEGALSDNVISDLEDITGLNDDDITRVGGDDRYETAAMIDDEMIPGSRFGHEGNTAFLATGANFPDALSVAGYAATKHAPILLTMKDEVPDETLNALDHGDADDLWIVGGTGVISNDVRSDVDDFADNTDRAAGSDRYGTATDVAESIWGVEDVSNNNERFAIARGDDFPDALAGSGLVANATTLSNLINGFFDIDATVGVIQTTEAIPTLLTNSSSLNSTTEDYLSDLFDNDETDQDSFILGGTGAISEGTEEDIAEILSDGDFQPTEDSPEIQDVRVQITNNGSGCGDNKVAESSCNDQVQIAVEVDNIFNEDDSEGDVTADTTDLGEDNSNLYDEEYELDCVTECNPDAGGFDNESVVYASNKIEVGKKGSSGNDGDTINIEVTAENSAGSDTADSDDLDIEN